MPPFAFSLLFRDVFFRALDVAGTYGVLVLFGLVPAAMAWRERYDKEMLSLWKVVPGGRPVLLGVGTVAALVIGNEVYETISGVLAGPV